MFKTSFSSSLLTFYLKGKILFDGNFLKFQIPNTILKVIPLGSSNKTIAVNKIASVDDSFGLNFGALVWGVLVTMFGFSLFSGNVLSGIFITAYGVLTILSSFEVKLQVNDTSGGGFFVAFIIFEKTKAIEVKDFILNQVSNRVDDTNTRVHSEKIIDAIKEKK